MDGTEKCFVALVAAITVLILSVMGYNLNATNAIERMVKQGADPIAAMCAVEGIRPSNQSICLEKAN